jgi:hypothetical protein
VVSRPDTLLLKARIAFQIHLSGRQTALVQTRVHQIKKIADSLQPSGRLLLMCRTRAYQIWKLRVEELSSDVHPSWSGRAKPYMEITCSRRTTVWTTVSHRLDAALKQEKFLAKFLENPIAQLSVQTASVQNTTVAHSAPQPINRGP